MNERKKVFTKKQCIMKKQVISLSVIAMIFLASVSFAQENTVSGTVSDENQNPLPGVSILVKGTKNGTTSDQNGHYSLSVKDVNNILVFSYVGYQTQEVKINGRRTLNVSLKPSKKELDEVVIMGYSMQAASEMTTGAIVRPGLMKSAPAKAGGIVHHEDRQHFNTEGYATIHENRFKSVANNPLSTFSVDVDVASYANVRRFIQRGTLPPKDAVRIEEMINYFSYDYPQPGGDVPFSINHELSECPWQAGNLLLHIGLQGKDIPTENLPPSNLVFLIDVSGSMGAPNKLPLLKQAFKLLTAQLRPKDRISMVVYAGNSGLVLPATSGKEKSKIIQALDRLSAGGSTAGGEGLKLAYKVAEENYMPEGNNRVILATDGDFNVGPSSNAEMERLIEKEREKGISISVLGFGMGNYKDDKMEIIADKGNGNYAYIDNMSEAKKVLVSEFGGTLFTIAKDVKFQLEFNPAHVKSYRLIGYENRLLEEEDFEDDTKDAGEIGAGHTVTALYEIVLHGSEFQPVPTDIELRYQENHVNPGKKYKGELLNMKLRYKDPKAFNSQLVEKVVKNQPRAFEETTDNFRFSASVAGFGMLLRDSGHKGQVSYEMVMEWAKNSMGDDEEGYRAEFLGLLKNASLLSGNYGMKE
jgi:Ca-activated chloride channel family protein